jgi:protein tyrosine phosphatase (PTP) superfamily phosphohydrolase (DUF442 family)
MDFITERIAVGNRREAADLDLLAQHGCTAVLNVAWDLDIAYPPCPDRHVFPVEYHKVGLIDGEGNRPETLVAAVLMLAQLLARHERVLVHCHAGVSRSSTVVTVYLSARDGIPVAQALAQVRRARPVANPHAALVRLAGSLDGWQHWLRR